MNFECTYKFAEAAALAVRGIDENAPISAEPQLADSLTEALRSLRDGSTMLQEPIAPEGLSGMFSGLNLDEVSLTVTFDEKNVIIFANFLR